MLLAVVEMSAFQKASHKSLQIMPSSLLAFSRGQTGLDWLDVWMKETFCVCWTKMKRKISIFSMFIPYPAFHWATSSVSQSFYVAHSRSAPISCQKMHAPISAMAGNRSVWVDRKQSVLKRKIKLKISCVTYWNTPMCRRDGVFGGVQLQTVAQSSLWWGGLI